MNRLEEIEQRLHAATAEPWQVIDNGPAGRGQSWRIDAEQGTLAQMRVYPGNGDDALLMACAPAYLRDLLAAVKVAQNHIPLMERYIDLLIDCGKQKRVLPEFEELTRTCAASWENWQAALAPLLKEVAS